MRVFRAQLRWPFLQAVGPFSLRLLAVLLVFCMMFAAYGGTMRVWLEQEEGAVLVDDKKHKSLRALPQRGARRLSHAWAAAFGAWLQWAVPGAVRTGVPERSYHGSCAIRAGSGAPLRC